MEGKEATYESPKSCFSAMESHGGLLSEGAPSPVTLESVSEEEPRASATPPAVPRGEQFFLALF